MKKENLRKLIHIGIGFIALLLKVLTPAQAALCAGLATLHNLFVLPHTVPSVFRKKYDWGIILYPIVVLGFILVFWDHLSLAAVGWAFLAFGDGFATLIGRALPIAKLPWNQEKSLGGMTAFILFSLPPAFFLHHFVGPSDLWLPWIAVTGVCLAFLESFPFPWNDNFVIFLFTSLLLLLGTTYTPGAFQPQVAFPMALGVNIAFAFVAIAFKLVSWKAFPGGVLIGVMIALGGGWVGYGVLLAFFFLATGATFLGYRMKEKQGIAQEDQGRRSSLHALANGFVPAFFGILLVWQGDHPFLFYGLVGALATATADTLGSEMGKLLGKRPFSFLRWTFVPPGTPGGVSWQGLFFSAFGAWGIASIPWGMGLFSGKETLIIGTASFLGAFLESLLGSTQRWHPELLNFFNTFLGSVLAIGAFQVWY